MDENEFCVLHDEVGIVDVFEDQERIYQQACSHFGQQAGLATGTVLRVVIARIIRVVLGFVGIILLGFILYGGFVWMKAGGNPERVKTAKRIFVNAAIGMVMQDTWLFAGTIHDNIA